MSNVSRPFGYYPAEENPVRRQETWRATTADGRIEEIQLNVRLTDVPVGPPIESVQVAYSLMSQLLEKLNWQKVSQ